MPVWWLTYQQSVFRWYHSNEHYKSFTHKMAAKASWHRYGTKLRHCHPILLCITNRISTFASKISFLFLIFHNTEFYFKNSLAFLKLVKIYKFYEFLKFIKYAFSICAASDNVYIRWKWRNFVPYLCQDCHLVFAAILWVNLLEMFGLWCHLNTLCR